MLSPERHPLKSSAWGLSWGLPAQSTVYCYQSSHLTLQTYLHYALLSLFVPSMVVARAFPSAQTVVSPSSPPFLTGPLLQTMLRKLSVEVSHQAATYQFPIQPPLQLILIIYSLMSLLRAGTMSYSFYMPSSEQHACQIVGLLQYQCQQYCSLDTLIFYLLILD